MPSPAPALLALSMLALAGPARAASASASTSTVYAEPSAGTIARAPVPLSAPAIAAPSARPRGARRRLGVRASQPAGESLAQGIAPTPIAPAAPAPSVNFDGVSSRDSADTNFGAEFEPPDQGLCVGNGFVVETVNSAYTVYDTHGTRCAGPFNVNGPFDEGLTEFTSDPRCYFDAADQHLVRDDPRHQHDRRNRLDGRHRRQQLGRSRGRLDRLPDRHDRARRRRRTEGSRLPVLRRPAHARHRRVQPLRHDRRVLDHGPALQRRADLRDRARRTSSALKPAVHFVALPQAEDRRRAREHRAARAHERSRERGVLPELARPERNVRPAPRRVGPDEPQLVAKGGVPDAVEPRDPLRALRARRLPPSRRAARARSTRATTACSRRSSSAAASGAS